jgi:glutathione synthase/RimK-type ligase-like ATP-grasp enzyme
MLRQPAVGLVTYAKVPDLTDDDRPLIEDFARLECRATPVIWDDASLDWSGFDALVLRSCWDYHLRPWEFAAWLDAIDELGVRLYNPLAVVRWNMHKEYLRELASLGVLVPDTVWVDRGAATSLSDVLREAGWRDAIVKPAISASATDTWRATAADEVRFAAASRRTDLLVQEVIPEIVAVGEWSLVFIDGAFSHAAIKRPKAGDFRVQTEHGGSADPAHASADVVARGAAITRHIPAGWLYARIDGVVTSRGFMLMEVECLEPHLFFGHKPDARRRFAGAIARSLRREVP